MAAQPAAPVAAPAPDCGSLTAGVNHGRLAAAAKAGKTSVACVQTTTSGKPPAGAAPTEILPAPDWCAINQWGLRRTGACIATGWVLTVYQLDEWGNIIGVIGEMNGNIVAYAYTAADISTWGFQLSINPTGGWGAIGGTRADGSAWCDGWCSLRRSDFPTQSVAIGGFVHGESYYDTTATAPGAVGFASNHYSWWFSNDAWPYPVGTTFTPPQVRCDSATPGKGVGCIVPDYTPWLVYNLSGPYPQLARHILDAQSSGLPVRLNRLTDPDLINTSRSIACPDRYPRPEGHSCDEYPFASTFQGALFAAAGPRTWDWCQLDIGQSNSTGPSGYSVCMIEAGQNSGGGSTLGWFYADNRIINADEFGVSIEP
ncbi:MAG TPA: hypothetical protein VGX25_08390 [Actinophytocola sp.]|uniref:NucA/NucB deoxyribonuclease domain-containing protein n=1 Tax=Actinophytocola sp. TaxID=1872138 RepID=UPI002DDD256D|nr:hypothetical protein [Actinophytocola sp.]HEV2779407.1 hypothetical protein [Actinophytocola sp.]